MIEISKTKDQCFALGYMGCSVLCEARPKCTPQCPFYKPVGCEDWIRREVSGEIWLIPPEEYARYVKGKNWNGR